jgi:hypothetical protein
MFHTPLWFTLLTVSKGWVLADVPGLRLKSVPEECPKCVLERQLDI